MKEIGSRYKIPHDNIIGHIVDAFTVNGTTMYQMQWEDDVAGHVYDYCDEDLEAYIPVLTEEEKAIKTMPNFSFV